MTEHAETAWAEELEPRAREMIQDPSVREDWDTARERIAGRLTGG